MCRGGCVGAVCPFMEGLKKKTNIIVCLVPPYHLALLNKNLFNQVLLNPLVVDCGNLQAPLNGNVQYKDTTLGSTATYSCDQGFILMGPQQRNCKSQGVWAGNAPSCVAAQGMSLTEPVYIGIGRVVWSVLIPNPAPPPLPRRVQLWNTS